MKTILVILFTISSFTAFTQSTKFPVEASVSNTVGTEPIQQRLSRIGLPMSWGILGYQASTTAISPNTVLISSLSLDNLTPPGYIPYITNIRIFSNRAIWFRPQFMPLASTLNASSQYGVSQPDSRVLIPKNGYVDIPYNAPLNHFGMTWRFLKYADSDTTKLDLEATVYGYEYAYSANVYSPNYLLVKGTSISRGTGATQGLANIKSVYTQQLLDSLSKKTGREWAIANKSVSGGTTAMLVNQLASDWQRVSDVKAIITEQGTNDPSAGANWTTYSNNLAKSIRYDQRNYPNALKFIIVPIPHGTPSVEATLSSWRSLLPAFIAAFKDDKIVLITSTGTLWNPATEVAGTYTFTIDGVHPNMAGNTLITQAVWSEFLQRNIAIPFN